MCSSLWEARFANLEEYVKYPIKVIEYFGF